MSYRDIRNFTEMLRALGYPKMVSMESFRKPNFPLIGSLLVWLAKRFEPDVEMPLDFNSEEERIALVRNVAQFMALKANLKLNTKRLYQADGYAVKELLKIAALLYDAMITNSSEVKGSSNEEDDMALSIRDFDIADKLHDLKQSRQLATEITMSGAALFDLLGKEIDLRGIRQTSVSRQYEVSDVEGGIQRAIETIRQEIDATKTQIDNVSATEANLDGKIERRKVEIDRYEKRLQTLKKVRPAFLEEFSTLEADLNNLFEQYSTRMRCLAQLEKLAADAERAQIQRAQMASQHKPITTTIPLEDTNEDDLLLDEPMNTHNAKMNQVAAVERKPPPSRQERPRARTGGRTRQDIAPPGSNAANMGKVYGGMNPGLSNSNSSLDITSDSDDDELFLDKDEPELVDVPSDDDSLGLEFSAMEINKRAPSGRMTSSKIQLQDNSDDDF